MVRVVVVGTGVAGLTMGAMLRRMGLNHCTVIQAGGGASSLVADTIPNPSASSLSPPVLLGASALASYQYLGMTGLVQGGIAVEEAVVEGMEALPLGLFPQEASDSRDLRSLPEVATASSLVSVVRLERATFMYGIVPQILLCSEESLRHRLACYCTDVRFDIAAVSVENQKPSEGGAVLYLEDGRQMYADLVILTEGKHRALGLGEAPTAPPLSGESTLVVSGLYDASRTQGAASSYSARVSATADKMLFTMDQRWNCVVHLSPSLKGLPTTSVPDVLQILANAFPSAFRPSEVIPSTVRFSLVGESVAQSRYNGRIVGIGGSVSDVATVLGPTLAIEDAFVLAEALKDVPVPTDDGFEWSLKHYSNARADRHEDLEQSFAKYRKFCQMVRLGMAKIPVVGHGVRWWGEGILRDTLKWRFRPETDGAIPNPIIEQ